MPTLHDVVEAVGKENATTKEKRMHRIIQYEDQLVVLLQLARMRKGAESPHPPDRPPEIHR
jgi:hypothetical protein